MPIFVLVLFFLGAVDAPIVLYLHWVHPAWTWHYLFDPASLPQGSALVVVLLQCGALVGAWYLGAHLIRSRSRRAVVIELAAAAALAAASALVLWRRLGAYASFDAFIPGHTTGLMEVKLGYVLIVLVAGLATAAAFVAVELARDARRIRAF
jgi:hypothetical protein